MFKRNRVSRAVVSAIAASAVGAPAHAQIEEVVVTATKREESLQDVPVAVSALKGDALEELRIGNFQDYIAYLPNVVQQGTGPGQNEIFIRGAATSQTILTLSSVQGLKPAVALYLDEQPVSMQGRNLDIYTTDIDRIEVLPGPQGTLFGASSQAGTVRLITNKPDHSQFSAGFDSSISSTKGGEMSHSVEAYLNLPITDDLAVRIAVYNDHAGGWIDNELNNPNNGGWNGSTLVIDRISGSGVLQDPADGSALILQDGDGDGVVNQTMNPADIESLQDLPDPRNDELVENNFNDATYTGGRFGVSYLVNEDWDILVQHTRQSLDTEGVWAYDPNLEGESSVNRFAPDDNEDDFGLTTWTLNGRVGMLDVIYTGGYLDRDVASSVDYTFYTNGGAFSAFYVCVPGAGTAYYYDDCFDPSKFYQEDTENTRLTHEFRFNTPEENRWRLTAGVFYDETELSSTGLFKIASTASPRFANLGRTLAAPPGTEGINSDGGPFPPEISFVNDVTRTTEQIAVFGQLEFDILPDLTAAFGVRYYEIDDEYKGSTTTVNVTDRLRAFGQAEVGQPAANEALFTEANALGAGIADPAAMAQAIEAGQLDISNLNDDGVLNADDVIFRASLDWRVTDEILLFGTFAQGFRPPVTNRVGGSLANASGQGGAFDGFRIPVFSQTDDLENYEIGFKADLFDRTLRLNVTGFFSEISDLQTSRFDPTNINFLWFADNVGDAEILGADGDFIWAPTNNLTISGAFSVLDTEITEINEELEGIAPPIGSELPFSADFSGNIRARYDFEIPPFGRLGGLMGYITGGVSYRGSSLVGMKMDAFVVEDTMQRVYGVASSGLEIVQEANTFAGQPGVPGQNGAPAVNADGGAGFRGGRYKQDDYALVNLGLGFVKDEWKAEFFVDNVTDTNAEVYIDTQQFTPHVVTNRPRTFGFRLSYDFQ